MIALGADSVLLGRAYLYALATHGQAGVANLLNLIEKEMKVAMTLTGANRLAKSVMIRWYKNWEKPACCAGTSGSG